MNKKIMINTDDIKYTEYPQISTDDVKDDQFRKELASIPDIIKNIRNKKINDFEKLVRKANNINYEIKNPLLIRHFLFKAVEEVNDDLINHIELILVMI